MPGLLRLSATSLALGALLLNGCKSETSAPVSATNPSLSEQLGNVQADMRELDALPGETRAEKLLYQAGIVSQMQTASLVMFDTQIKTVEMAGNQAMATELKENRELLTQALDKEVPDFVKDAGLLYDKYFTPEEIERLIVLHSDPVMRKLVETQPKLSQEIIPAATEFGNRAGQEFERLVRQKTSGNE